MTKKVYPYTCPHCKDAPRRGQWRRSWRWKTEKGFLNHKCYADEAPSVPQVLYHHDRENSEVPSWLAEGDPLLCPHCAGAFTYSAARVPSLHFACPLCGAEVQWQRGGAREVAVLTRVCSLCGAEMVERRGRYGTFWGCSAYTRANPCRGKSVMRSVVESQDMCELVAFVEKA